MHGTLSPAQPPSARLPASTGLTPAACTVTRSWPGPGTGSATSARRSRSGPPNSLTTTALIRESPVASLDFHVGQRHGPPGQESEPAARYLVAPPVSQ